MKRLVLLFITFSAVSEPINVAQEKVVICGVGKNIAHCLPNMIKKISSLGKQFQDYAVIIYENNSTDKTQKILRRWATKNTRVHIISETLSPQELYNRTQIHARRDQAPCRMELIAYARNVVLQKALSPEFDDYNFVIMTDLDFSQGWKVKDVLSCFNVDVEWDGMAANSVHGDAIYYDRYAYRDEAFPLGPELLGDEFWNYPAITISTNDDPHKVYSAFGGVAVYKRNALKNCSYSGIVTQDLENFLFAIINNDISKTNRDYVLYKKILQNDDSILPIKFQANCGYDGPTVCEHSTLHASMFCNGYNKIYVNPAMICLY